MIAPSLPANEKARIAALHALAILDTPPEERFDRVTRLARRAFDVPIALVSFVDCDRLWFKSAVGLDASEAPRDVSFCGHTVAGDALLIIPDATQDIRFASNPLVAGGPRIRFYAGHPVRDENGFPLGTLCLIDMRPREMTPADCAMIHDLACMVEQELLLTRMATTDDLTGISNRRGFEAIADHALALCRRRDEPATLLYFDLDGFKSINDVHGHAAGDEAIGAFADALLGTFRSADVVGRIGGDEFVVLCSGADAEQARVPLGRLRTTIETADGAAERPYDIEFSVGMAVLEAGGRQSLNDLLRVADRAMFERKHAAHAERHSLRDTIPPA